jgi:hypothetical protein
MLPGQQYRHYKGTVYQIVALAKHTETLEDMVVYQDTGSPEKVWVRPKGMFLEEIEKDGQIIKRFQPIEG